MDRCLPLLGCLIVMLLSGCATIEGYPKQFKEFNDNFLCQIQNDILLGESDATNCARFQKAPSQKARDNTIYKKYRQYRLCPNDTSTTDTGSKASDSASSKCDKRQLRAEIVGDLLVFIDLQYNEFRKELYSTGVTTNLAGDMAVAGLSVAGVLAGTEAAKTTLAAISTGVVGMKTSFTESALFKMTMPAIINEMDNRRAEIAQKIHENLAKSIGEYPLQRALSDVNTYFLAGTLPGAINNLVKETAAKTEKSGVDSNIASLEKAKASLIATTDKFTPDNQVKLIIKLGDDKLSLLSNTDKSLLLKALKWAKFDAKQPAPGAEATGLCAAYMIRCAKTSDALSSIQKIIESLNEPEKKPQ